MKIIFNHFLYFFFDQPNPFQQHPPFQTSLFFFRQLPPFFPSLPLFTFHSSTLPPPLLLFLFHSLFFFWFFGFFFVFFFLILPSVLPSSRFTSHACRLHNFLPVLVHKTFHEYSCVCFKNIYSLFWSFSILLLVYLDYFFFFIIIICFFNYYYYLFILIIFLFLF